MRTYSRKHYLAERRRRIVLAATAAAWAITPICLARANLEQRVADDIAAPHVYAQEQLEQAERSYMLVMRMVARSAPYGLVDEQHRTETQIADDAELAWQNRNYVSWLRAAEGWSEDGKYAEHFQLHADLQKDAREQKEFAMITGSAATAGTLLYGFMALFGVGGRRND